MTLAAVASSAPVEMPWVRPSIRPMTVAFVIDSSQVGGAEHVILMLLQQLPRERFSCHIICPSSGPMIERYRQVANTIEIPGRTFLSPRGIGAIASALKRLQPDVVHTCLYTSDVSGVLASKLAGVPRTVCHIVGRNFYLIDERGVRRLRKRFFSLIYRGIYRLADEVVAVSEAVKQDLAQRPGLRVPAGRIRVVPHTVDPADLAVPAGAMTSAEARYGLRRSGPMIAVVASLIPTKGHRYLLEAMQRVAAVMPQVRCLIVGEGPHRQRLQQLVTELGLRRHVALTGELDGGIKNAIMQASRLIALPSLSEGLPVVVLEAMALGKPVVATDAGGTGEAVLDGVTGMLVPPRNAAALAAALLRVLDDEQLAERMGQAGRRRFDAHFSSARMMENFERLYVNGRLGPREKAAVRIRRVAKTAAAVVCAAAGETPLARRHHGRRVRILMYHGVLERVDRPAAFGDLFLTTEAFARQMRHLARGFNVLALDEVSRLLASRGRLPERAAVITFDDGYRNTLTQALPVLRSLRLPATVFISPALTGAQELLWFDALRMLAADGAAGNHSDAYYEQLYAIRRLPVREQEEAIARILALSRDQSLTDRHPEFALADWDEWRRAMAGGGVQIGSHAMAHEDLVRLPADERLQNLRRSKELIEAELKYPCRAIAYPYGASDPSVTDAARQAGYTCGVTTNDGLNGPEADLMTLRRTMIGDKGSLMLFRARASGMWQQLRAAGRIRR